MYDRRYYSDDGDDSNDDPFRFFVKVNADIPMATHVRASLSISTPVDFTGSSEILAAIHYSFNPTFLNKAETTPAASATGAAN
jgi:hypothetical protein